MRGRAGAKAKAMARQRAAEQAAVYEEVERLLNEPAFQVLSLDRMLWFNPYTGKPVEAAFDWRETARDLLLSERPWEVHPARSYRHMLALRWHHYLRNSIKFEARLRFFHPDGRWLNPFTGNWVESVHRTGGKIGASTLKQMAKTLAMTPKADGDAEMLSPAQLKEIVHNTAESERRARELMAKAGGTAQPQPEMAKPIDVATVVIRKGEHGTGTSTATETFGWTELFGDNSPFDHTPTSNPIQSMAEEVHPLLAKAGLDWALHPGFEMESHGYIIQLSPTVAEQVVVVLAYLTVTQLRQTSVPEWSAEAADP